MPKTAEIDDQAALFDVPAATPLPQPKAKPGGSGQAVWVTAKGQSRCDDCVRVVHERWPQSAPAIRHARMKRKQSGEETLHCYEHAQAQMARDGVGIPQAMKDAMEAAAPRKSRRR